MKDVEDTRKGSSADVATSKMSEQQRRAVVRSWAVLSRDVSGRVRRLFLDIFRRDPELKTFFTFGDLAEHEMVNVRACHFLVAW